MTNIYYLPLFLWVRISGVVGLGGSGSGSLTAEEVMSARAAVLRRLEWGGRK